MKQKEYILYLEDDSIDAIKFTSTLESLGFKEEIIVMENGQDGLSYLDSQRSNLPRIIVLDLNMPQMDGLEFLESIKKDEHFKSIPVIVLTTSEEKVDIQSSFQKQVAGYMVKPFDQKGYDNMVELIKAYWDKSVTGHMS